MTEDETSSLLLSATVKEICDATRLAHQVNLYLTSEAGRPPEIKEATWRRKVAAYRRAAETHGNGFLGLLTRRHRERKER